MLIRVFTKQREAAKAELKSIDWTNSSDRKWLMNHLHWAMNNSAAVTLQPYSF